MNQNLLEFAIKVNQTKILFLQITSNQCDRQFQQFCSQYNLTKTKAETLKQKMIKSVDQYYSQLKNKQNIFQNLGSSENLVQIYQPQNSIQDSEIQLINKSRQQQQSLIYPQHQGQQKQLQFIVDLTSNQFQQQSNSYSQFSQLGNKKSQKQVKKELQIHSKNKIMIEKKKSFQKEKILNQFNYIQHNQQSISSIKKLILLKDHIKQADNPNTKIINKGKIKIRRDQQSPTNLQKKLKYDDQVNVFERLYTDSKKKIERLAALKKNQSQSPDSFIKEISIKKIKPKALQQFYTNKRNKQGSSFCFSKRQKILKQQKNKQQRSKQKQIIKRMKQQKGKKKQTSVQSCQRHQCNYWNKSIQIQNGEKEILDRKKVLAERLRQYEYKREISQKNKINNTVLNEDLIKKYKEFDVQSKKYRF